MAEDNSRGRVLLRDLTAAVGRMNWSSEEELGGTPQCLLWEQNTETLEQLIEEASDTSLETQIEPTHLLAESK